MRSTQNNAMASGNVDHYHKRSTAEMTIAGAIDIGDDWADVLAINGGGSNRNCDLPAPSAKNEGRGYEIWNVGATNSLVIRNFADDTLFTLTVGHVCFVRNVKGTWRAAGTVTNT